MKKIILTLVTALCITGLSFANSNTEKVKTNPKQNKELKQSEDKKAENRLYTWEVKTESGYAKGTALSFKDAIKMINLISKNENTHSKVITSKALK